MAWYDEAVFYHIYPLGLAGAPIKNKYEEPVHRLLSLLPWITHIKNIGCNALYIGPLFESVGHGYETTDYRKLDSRLGTNDDLKRFVAECHEAGIKVIFDGVFNHTGRDFFAFQDIKANRETSAYRDWYCNVNFRGNNEYGDGFSYDNWGGYNLLAKLNQANPAVRDYFLEVVRFWVKEFDVDGIRLDAADVLNFEFMKALRRTANEVKPDFWLMGEVIHGDYGRWANENTLHSVTNYMLHKAFYSGHNDHNYFEIAHTLRYVKGMTGGLKLYDFVDNHDVERISTKLENKAHFVPVHILLYTLPGIPSIYYGSEFGVAGRKERNSDASLRPALDLDQLLSGDDNSWTEKGLRASGCLALIRRLGQMMHRTKVFFYGEYEELTLTTRQYAFRRKTQLEEAIVMVNNDDGPAVFHVPAGKEKYKGVLSGQEVKAENGWVSLTIEANSGEILLPVNGDEDLLLEKEDEKAKMTGSPGSQGAAAAKEGLPGSEGAAAVKGALPGSEGAAAAKEGLPGSEGAGAAKEALPEAVCITVTKETLSEPSGSTKDLPLHVPDKPYEEMEVEELQAAILEKLSHNGPVTDQMRRDVKANVWKNSLINWVKSFR